MKLLPLSFGFGFAVVLRHGLPDSPAWPGIFDSLLFISGVWGCWREAPQLASNHILESSHLFSYHLIE